MTNVPSFPELSSAPNFPLPPSHVSTLYYRRHKHTFVCTFPSHASQHRGPLEMECSRWTHGSFMTGEFVK
jgi:hypothetical protein